MRRFEIFTKDNHVVKLTITTERVTVKLPKSITLVDAERIIKFFKKVADQHPSPQTTLRGNNKIEKVLNNGIELYAGVRANRNGVLVSTHKFEE